MIENFKVKVGSFELGSGSNYVLLLHGYPESPYNLRLLGKHLANNGFHVMAPLLPGFGKNYEYLYEHSDWREWINAVDQIIENIQKENPQNIFVSGISMGGFISLYTAIYHPEIKAIATMGALLYVKGVLKWLVPIMQLFTKYVSTPASIDIDVMDAKVKRDPVILELSQRYNKVVLKGANSELKIMKKVRKNLHLIKQPILICQGRYDKTIPPETADYIHERISSKEKTIKWYENSGHQLPLDNDKEELFKDIVSFFRKYI